jgi:hypothetical protein
MLIISLYRKGSANTSILYTSTQITLTISVLLMITKSSFEFNILMYHEHQIPVQLDLN